MEIMRNPLKRLWKGIAHPSPRGRVRWALVFVMVLALLTGFLDYPRGWNRAADKMNSWLDRVPRTNVWGLRQAQAIRVGHYPVRPFRLGLDLAGGAHLVYDADLSQIESGERDDAMEGVRDVIERRVNAFGVAEPLVQTARTGEARRVVVELAGVKDVKAAIKQIGETPVLEFKEEATPEPGRSLTTEEYKDLTAHNEGAKKRADDVISELRAQVPEPDFAALVQKYSDDPPTIKDVDGDLGFITSDSAYSELWEFADKQGAGKIVLSPLETEEGWNIVYVKGVEERGKEVHARHLLVCFRGAKLCDNDTSKDDARRKVDELRMQATPDNFEQLIKDNSTEPRASQTGGDLGWFGPGAYVKPFEDTAFAQQVGMIEGPIETQFGFHLIHKLEERPRKAYNIARILLKKKTVSDYLPPPESWRNTGLSGKHLTRAAIQFDPNTSTPEVGLEFNDEGRKLFAEITGRNVNKLVAIFLDGEPISVPRVNEPILEGRAVITGNFTIKDAKLLAQRLNAGALPVPIHLVSQQTVGATLGEASVRASLKAGLIGFALVAIFMILYYRLAGVLAVIALIIYTAVVLTLFKIIPVTLSLAGIAGFILSIGMAVDANVLQFERLKEELRAGKGLQNATEDAFKRAWPSIRDSHLTTLFGALILFWFSTSLVKGFGLTLSVGVLMSLFSAITVTRVLLRMVSPYVVKAGWYGTRIKR